MEIFKKDPAGYERWLRDHPTGYVLSDRMLHRVECWHIGEGWEDADPTKKPKVCSERRFELVAWFRDQQGENPQNCFSCAP